MKRLSQEQFRAKLTPKQWEDYVDGLIHEAADRDGYFASDTDVIGYTCGTDGWDGGTTFLVKGGEWQEATLDELDELAELDKQDDE